MPAAKPKHQHRKPIAISCSENQFKMIELKIEQLQERDRNLNKKPLDRSKYIHQILESAIASNNALFSTESYTHGSTVTFQISCSRDRLNAINDFCDRNLDKMKRSRWIVYQIINFSY